MSTQYYQVGGFGGQINTSRATYDDKELANALAGSSSPLRSQNDPQGPVEIILGIRRSGSSHLLVTTEQATALSSTRGLVSSNRPPYLPRHFESLSPIYFNTVEELAKKLSHLKPKKSGNGQDTSQANRIYNNHDDEPYRAAFEHGRVIYRILNKTIDAVNYGVESLSWIQTLRVCSFVFNVKGIDDRKIDERLRNPIVLDVGLCDASIPSLDPVYSTARHMINQKNSMMGGNRRPFAHGQSQMLHDSHMQDPIQEYFKDYRVPSAKTMILLVYNKKLALSYLQKMGVDTSAWCYDLKALLYPGSPMLSQNHQSKTYGYSGGLQRRSRSRSPRRHDSRALYHSPPLFQSNRDERYKSPSVVAVGQNQASASLYPPVCLLDVQQLYIKLMSNDQVRGVVDIARQFGMTGVDGICAGNEAGVIIKIWKDMVTGPAIDEQRQLRSARPLDDGQQNVAQDAGPSGIPVTLVDSDDEQDPNDIVAQPAPIAVKGAHMSFEDDESDYGDNSSDSD